MLLVRQIPMKRTGFHVNSILQGHKTAPKVVRKIFTLNALHISEAKMSSKDFQETVDGRW